MVSCCYPTSFGWNECLITGGGLNRWCFSKDSRQEAQVSSHLVLKHKDFCPQPPRELSLCEGSSLLMRSPALLLLIAVAMRAFELSAQCCWNSLQSFLSLSSLLSLKSSFERSSPFLFSFFFSLCMTSWLYLCKIQQESLSGEFDWMFVLSGFWLGIELDKPSGKNDGSVGGVRYFKCPSKHGVFAPPSRVQRYVSFSVQWTGFELKSSSAFTLNKIVHLLLLVRVNYE